MAEGGPIPILLLYVQHLCQPVRRKWKLSSAFSARLFVQLINLLEKQDGEASEAAHTPHFLAPVLLHLAGTLYNKE